MQSQTPGNQELGASSQPVQANGQEKNQDDEGEEG